MLTEIGNDVLSKEKLDMCDESFEICEFAKDGEGRKGRESPRTAAVGDGASLFDPLCR
jgi:hypothetical protein